jgi:predicted molibdopterin-dependent oxidoreductase YjgC
MPSSLNREVTVTEKLSRSKEIQTFKMEIDHRTVSFPEGATVLRVAELNNVYIPSLCSHKDLSPFGGCRMCIVEIEGMRGYPLACSTIAEEGMKILTDTATLRDMRKEILQLILSEHPSSCLVCGESEECKQYQYTIRKTGVSTGCRYCPNDNQCELQNVVERIGLAEITYPVYYRGYEAEHDDPFFDRDYNVCILCGRCVRMCQELRGTSILSFKYRGPKVQIGPSFGKNHVEAGCEFCGACVSVCPTGALADKSSKWDGKPDGIEISTCPFCSIGCQIDLHHKGGRLSKVYPNLDSEINDGQLCVRGRFSLPEATHYHERAKKPMLRRGKYFREVTWPEAQTEVVSKLKGLKKDEFLMVVSGDLTNESLYAAQKFVRHCLGSDSIDSTARLSLPGGLGLWSKLFSLPISIKGIAEADSIIAVGLDSRFYFSVVGVQIRRALKKGADLVTIDARDSNLARYTDHWLRPRPGAEGMLLSFMAQRLGGKKGSLKSISKQAGLDEDRLKKAIESLDKGENLAVIISPTVFEYGDNTALVDAIFQLAKRKDTIFVPLYHGSNVRGSIELGAFGELLPGGAKSKKQGISLADVMKKQKRPKVIYLVGQAPFQERPDCDYLISQDIYYPPFPVDAFLPAASFAEAGGTLTNIEGRVQELVKIENLPDGAVTGFVRPDWKIFSELGQQLDSEDLQFKNEEEILREIHETIPGFPARPDRQPRLLKATSDLTIEKRDHSPVGTGEMLLVVEPAGFQHRGIDLSYVVEGLKELAIERGLRLHPDDLAKRGLAAGEEVSLIVDGKQLIVTTKADSECPVGVAYLSHPVNFGGLSDCKGLELLYGLESSPIRVSIGAVESNRY